MLTDEQKARLTPEQIVIAEKWEVDADLRDAEFDKIEAALNAGDKEEYHRLLTKMREDLPDYCEHDRSMSGTCWQCDELSRLLHPEVFCKECEEHQGHVHGGKLNEDGICPDCAEDD